MRSSSILALLVIISAILVSSCSQEQAVDQLMQNKVIVANIMTKMWEDPETKNQLVEKVLADQEGYGRFVESTLSDSTRFTALMEKVASNEELKKQVMGLAEAWKKAATKKK